MNGGQWGAASCVAPLTTTRGTAEVQIACVDNDLGPPLLVRLAAVTDRQFHYFASLPAEIQQRIWQQVVLGAMPRTIFLKSNRYKEPTIPHGRVSPLQRLLLSYTQHNSPICCTATTMLVPEIHRLMLTCRDARAAVLSVYVPTVEPIGIRPSIGELGLYFSPFKDSIFVDEIWPWDCDTHHPAHVYEARNLYIHCNAFWGHWRTDAFAPRPLDAANRRALLMGRKCLRAFRHLEKLFIVFRVTSQQERDRVDCELAKIRVRAPNNLPTERLKEYAYAERAREWYEAGNHDLAWPCPDIDLTTDEIVEELQGQHMRDPQWQVPEVRAVGWSRK